MNSVTGLPLHKMANHDEGVEAAAIEILKDFQAGKITSDALLGPLYGTREVERSPGAVTHGA